MGETPGLMTSSGPDGELIPIWNREMQYTGVHSEEIDVTGGIFLKAERAAEISEFVEHVWFIDGTQTERIQQIVEDGYTYGTRIVNP
jgi:isopentenyl phosphate kinase